jgi:hypothetical protein
MWVAKRNHLDELDAMVVSDLPSEILFKKSILSSFLSAQLTTLVKILGCYKYIDHFHFPSTHILLCTSV